MYKIKNKTCYIYILLYPPEQIRLETEMPMKNLLTIMCICRWPVFNVPKLEFPEHLLSQI